MVQVANTVPEFGFVFQVIPLSVQLSSVTYDASVVPMFAPPFEVKPDFGRSCAAYRISTQIKFEEGLARKARGR